MKLPPHHRLPSATSTADPDTHASSGSASSRSSSASSRSTWASCIASRAPWHVRQALGWTVVWIAGRAVLRRAGLRPYEYHWFGWASRSRMRRERRRGGDPVRHRLPARMVAVGRQHLRHRGDLHVHEDPGAVPVPRAVLGHRRRHRAARRHDRDGCGADPCVRLDVLCVRRDPADLRRAHAQERGGAVRSGQERARAPRATRLPGHRQAGRRALLHAGRRRARGDAAVRDAAARRLRRRRVRGRFDSRPSSRSRRTRSSSSPRTLSRSSACARCTSRSPG